MIPDPLLVLSTPIHPLHLKQAREILLERVSSKQKTSCIFRDVHGVVRCQDDPAFLEAHQKATLVCPDGMPLVWIARRRGHQEAGRVYGPDMMREMMSATTDGTISHFLYGGKPGVADQLKQTLEEQYPGVNIVGTYCPPFGPLGEEEEAQLTSVLRELQPDLFWVGLSTPKQEFFMQQYLSDLDTTVMLGVGAAFDYLSGAVSEPPVWIQRSGFQWLYRICSEPRRLFGRYLKTIPRFLYCLSKEKRKRS